MAKIVPIHETEHYAVIPCKDIVSLPVTGENPVARLCEIWCSFYEDLFAAGYRPLHRLQRPQAVLCEKNVVSNSYEFESKSLKTDAA